MSDLSICSTDLLIGASLLLYEEETVSVSRSRSHPPDLTPSPLSIMFGSALKILLPLREGEDLSQVSPQCYTISSTDRRAEPSINLSRKSHQPFTCHCSVCAELGFHRQRQFDTSIGLGLQSLGVGLTSPKSITDSLLSTPYLSFVKSFVAQLLVDSSGFLKKRTLSTPASVKRNVSPPNVKWRCMLISITVLLSCVPVRLGPEDATDFVTTIFGSADWVLTSCLKVTKFQVSGSAANLALTHSSPTLNSLSSYFSVLAMFYVVMFSDCRVLSSLSCCSSEV